LTREISTPARFLGAKHRPCDGCGRAIKPHPRDGWRGIPIVVITEEVNWFRGDDVVRMYHLACEPGGGAS
jgi:hypothetical protein